MSPDSVVLVLLTSVVFGFACFSSFCYFCIYVLFCVSFIERVLFCVIIVIVYF